MPGHLGHPNDPKASEPTLIHPFNEKIVRGATAQRIVERLFAEHGYQVLPYGIETQFAGWTHDHRLENSAAARLIRNAPDVIVKVPLAAERKRFYFVEAKFRMNGVLTRKDAERYDGYPDTIIVAVSPAWIRAAHVQRFLKDERLHPIAFLRKLRLKEAVVEHFEGIAARMFGGLATGQAASVRAATIHAAHTNRGSYPGKNVRTQR